jgi:hypothetical protein
MARFGIRGIVSSGPVTKKFVIIIMENAYAIFLEKNSLLEDSIVRGRLELSLITQETHV